MPNRFNRIVIKALMGLESFIRHSFFAMGAKPAYFDLFPGYDSVHFIAGVCA